MTTERNDVTATGLGKKAGILAVSRIITTLAQLATVVILARILPEEKNGALLILLTSYMAILNIAQLGLPDSIFFYFGQLAQGAHRTFLLITARTLFILGLFAALVLMILDFLPYWKVEVHGLFILLIPLILLELPTTPIPNALIATNRTGLAGLFNIISGVMQFAAIAVSAIIYKSLFAILIFLVVYGLVRFVISLVIFLRYFPSTSVALPAGIVIDQLKYSIPLSAAQGLWSLNKQVDKWIVAIFLPPVLVAAYGFGAWEIPIIPVIAYAIGAVLMPELVAHHFDNKPTELLSLWLRAIRRVTVFIVPMVILFEVIAEEFIILMFSEKYLIAVIPFRIYTIILLQRVASYSAILKAVGETRVITRSAIYLLIINTGLSVPMVIWLGIAGPPLATLFANIFSWTYAMLKIRTALGVQFKAAFPFRFYAKTLLISLISGGVVYFGLLHSHFIPSLAIVVKSSLFISTYALLAVVSGVLTQKDWHYFMAMLKLSTGKRPQT